MKKFIWITIVLFGFILLGGSVFFRLMAIQNTPKPQSVLEIHRAKGIPVTAASPEKKDLREALELTGTVVPFKEIEVAARRGDEVTSSSLVLGKFCRQDEVVIELYDQYVRAQLAAAEAGVAQAFNIHEKLRKGTRTQQIRELEAAVRASESQRENAEREFVRMQELQKTGSITRQNADRILAARDQSGAGLEAARQRLNLAREGAQTEDILAAEAAYNAALAARSQARLAVEHSTIKAPFDGFINQILVEKGEQVGNGKPLFVIVDTGKLFLRLDVPQNHISRIRSGQEVSITLDSYPDKIVGTVSEIAPNADPVSKTYVVKIIFDNVDYHIRPGVFAHASIVLVEKPGTLTVPRLSVIEQNGSKGVFVVDNRKARFQKVETGIRGNEDIEIVSGLQGNSVVVTMGQGDLKEDSLVEIQTTDQFSQKTVVTQ